MNNTPLPDDHDCRHRVRAGFADRVAVYEGTNVKLKYECDQCKNVVWVICERYNVQVQDENGDVYEPSADAGIWSDELGGPV